MATKAELQSALDEANAERSEGDQIVPAGSNKADLEAALAAAVVEVDGNPAASLIVTAPLVQIQVGNRVIHLSQGDIVPGNASQESLDHLRGLGFVAESE